MEYCHLIRMQTSSIPVHKNVWTHRGEREALEIQSIYEALNICNLCVRHTSFGKYLYLFFLYRRVSMYKCCRQSHAFFKRKAQKRTCENVNIAMYIKGVNNNSWQNEYISFRRGLTDYWNGRKIHAKDEILGVKYKVECSNRSFNA